jgi:hypothetical protein
LLTIIVLFKIGWFTSDNASNNDTAMKEVARQLNANKEEDDTQWDPVEGRVRCMEHAIHLAAGHFIRVVSPTSARTLAKKLKAFHNVELDDDDITLDPDLGDDDNGGNNDAASEVGDFTVGDTIGKSLALVKQVSTVSYMQVIVC